VSDDAGSTNQHRPEFLSFAHLVGSPFSFGLTVELSDPPELYVVGEHALRREDFKLEPDEMAICGTILERLAYRLLAMELDSALSEKFRGHDRFNHSDPFIRDASVVVRLIRNAVAHNILDLVWKVDRKLQGRKITIQGVLDFDTSEINNKTLNRLHFGGPIALLKLSEMIAARIEPNASESSRRHQ
jgi:hypothetical protein